MAHKKGQGSTKNLRDSNPKYLGTKLYDGEKAMPGSILVRQRGTKVRPGKNVRMGIDHTLFALRHGTVKFTTRNLMRFNGRIKRARLVNVIQDS